MRALQELCYIPLTGLPASTLKALDSNPETLKITFENPNTDLHLRLMQGFREMYRFSVSFQVRPVMIATAAPTSYNLLVGVDYTKNPITKIGEKGINIPVIPSMGPVLTGIEPQKFEPDDKIIIYGEDLNLFDLEINIDDIPLQVLSKRFDRLECIVDGTISGGQAISAGSHIISADIRLNNDKKIRSNFIVGDLLPGA